MATHVADVELSAPAAIVPPDGTIEVLALVRWHGVPIGVASLDGSGAISAARVREIVTAQVAPPDPLPEPPPAATPLSVVVCTRERAADLARCLDGLRPIAAAGHEVIVVDNAPLTAATTDVVARHPVRYVREPRAGLSYARNCGLREARHAIVAFTDDDAVPDTRWIDALAQPFADERIACVTGLVMPIELRTTAQHVFEAYAQHRRRFAPHVFTAADTVPATAGVVGIGANMALRRDLALRLGGFDTRLGAGARTCAGEENDMFARTLDAGFAIAYTPKALVWHRHRDTNAELRRCIFGYGVGVYAFLTKRVVEGGDLRALIVAARWLVGPFLRAARLRVAGEAAAPMRLLLLEAAGAAAGPARFLAEHRRQRVV